MQNPGERKCSNKHCQREGNFQCARCKSEFYCSKPCQKKSWKVHKLSCSECRSGKQMKSKAAGMCEIKECSKPGNLCCSRCKTVGYCSTECQKKDWKQHKVNCKQTEPSEQDGISGKKPSFSGSTSEKRPGVNPSHLMQDGTTENPFMRHFILETFGRLSGKTKSVAEEYVEVFPGEQDHAKRIEKEEFAYKTDVVQQNLQGPVFPDSVFSAPEMFMRRWGSCMSDLQHLLAFLSAPNRKFGDIYERPQHIPMDKTFFQTMRSTVMANLYYVIGKNYVGFGFVDAFQLLWGRYLNDDNEEESLVPMKFFGYDMSRVVILRSKLMYLALKNFEESEISITSILQLWFSSCWDFETESAFNMLVSEALEHEENFGFDVKDKQLLRTWMKKKFSVNEAKKLFSKGLRNAMFDDVWQMKYESDRVRFCRYLFTGCIFVDENTVVCGNPTMFTDYEGATKIDGELFFKAFDTKALRSYHFSNQNQNSLYDTIVLATQDAAKKFRQRIATGQIECNFETRFVDPKDLKFAAFIKSLDPYGIDWSNVPDYMDKKLFIEFARACSAKETVHTLHFINWVQYVFGSCHVDWRYGQEECFKVYCDFKKQTERARKIDKAIKNPANLWLQFFDGNNYLNNLNEINLYLGTMFRKTFEDYFLSDEKGNKLNRFDYLVCDGIVSHFFQQSPTTFRSAFSFNEGLRLQIVDETTAKEQFKLSV